MKSLDERIVNTIMDDMSNESTVKCQEIMDNMTEEEAEVLKDAAAHAAGAAYAIGMKDVIVKEVKALALIGCGALAVKLAKNIF